MSVVIIKYVGWQLRLGEVMDESPGAPATYMLKKVTETHLHPQFPISCNTHKPAKKISSRESLFIQAIADQETANLHDYTVKKEITKNTD